MIKKRKRTAWAMAIIMLLLAFSPLNATLGSTPDELEAEVIVTGIGAGEIIDGSEEIQINVTFDVPVIGDGVSDYFEHGDVVTLLLSESFHFDPIPPNIDLYYDTKKLGTVVLGNNSSGQAIATITFDGDEDIFDPDKLDEGEPPYADVSGEFNISLRFNGSFEEDDDGNKTVNILDKTYILQLPGDIIEHTVEKTGVVDLDGGTIEWTVQITATSDTEPEPTHIDLKGYVFEDDLADVGDYVNGSFSLTGGTLEVPDPSSTPPVTSLTYTFPEGSMSPQVLTFETEIPDSVLTAGGDITNIAQLYLDDEEVGFDDFDVTITKPSVKKTYVTDDDISGAIYDPTNRTITWYIEVNNEGRTLNDLIITDELQGGLTLIKAQWQKAVHRRCDLG